MDGMTRSTLVIEELAVRYPKADRDALAEISLTVEKGERVALVGPKSRKFRSHRKLRGLSCAFARY